MTTTDVTADIKPPIPLDERLITDMPFEGGDETRKLLTRCSVSKAFQIEQLGCTGAAGIGLTIDEITALRLGLAGGGVGLPCFVPPDRYCLAHNTVGGLQREQEARHWANVMTISRDLTAREAGQVAFTEAVRHSGKGGVGEQMATAQGAFSGYGEMPRGVEMVEGGEAPRDAHELLPTAAPSFAPSFVCPEHTKPNWSCRFCVAQAITEGELDTSFAVHFPEVPIGPSEKELAVVLCLTAEELAEQIKGADARGVGEVVIYALIKTLTRKLA